MRIYISLLLAVGGSGWAATPFKRSLTVKNNSYLQDGVFTGGEAGGGATLLGVRRLFSQKAQIERVIVEMGDRNAKPTGKKISYFQASVDSTNKRVVMDLTQLKMSLVSEQKIQNVFKKSPYVASAEFTLDPVDKAGILVLNLKRPMKLEVFELLDNKKPARVVMDLTPIKKGKL